MYDKKEIKRLLDEKGLAYEWVDHEAAFTIEDMVRMGFDKELDVAKNLFLRDGKGENHYLIVVRSDKKVNLKEFGQAFGLSKLSFASEERLMKFLGLKKDFLEMKKIGVHPNDNTATVYLLIQDLLEMIQEHGNQLKVVGIPQ